MNKKSDVQLKININHFKVFTHFQLIFHYCSRNCSSFPLHSNDTVPPYISDSEITSQEVQFGQFRTSSSVTSKCVFILYDL